MNVIQNAIQIRNQKAAEKLEKKRIQIELAAKLKDAGISNAEIARLMEISESSVRSLLNQTQAAKISRYVDFKDMDRQSIQNIVDGWVMSTGKSFLNIEMINEWAEHIQLALRPKDTSLWGTKEIGEFLRNLPLEDEAVNEEASKFVDKWAEVNGYTLIPIEES